MGKAIIDISEAIEMRVKGSTLRDIGEHFGTTAEAVRQAFQRAEKKKRKEKKLARLLVTTNVDKQSGIKSPADIAKTIDDWTTILEAAKKGIALESEVASLRERLSKVELLLKSL